MRTRRTSYRLICLDILDMIRKKPRTARELKELTEYAPDTVARVLKDVVEWKFVRRNKDPAYRWSQEGQVPYVYHWIKD